MNLKALALLLLAGAMAGPAVQAQDLDQMPPAYLELLRGDIKSKKREIIGKVIPVAKDQEEKFWTLYKSFESELDKIADERLKLIQDFSDTWSDMTDAQARSQARRALDLTEQRIKINRKYYLQFEKEFSPLLAAKLFQLEMQLQTAVDYQRVKSLPLIK